MTNTVRLVVAAILLIDRLTAEGVINACSGEIKAARIAQYITAAIEWVRTQPQVDSSRIFLLGWSMGGGGLLSWLSDTDAGECQELVARSPSRTLITSRVHEGARHGFDIESAPEVFDIGNGMTVGYQKQAAEKGLAGDSRFSPKPPMTSSIHNWAT